MFVWNWSQRSLAELPAYKRYDADTLSPTALAPSEERFKLGDVTQKSLGTTIIRFPIDEKRNYLEYQTDVVNIDLPILFGLDKMKEQKWYVTEVTNELCNYDEPTMKVQLTFKRRHLYLEWNYNLVFFSRAGLLKMHRRFAHPTADKSSALLRRAYPRKYSSSTKNVLEDIVRRCNSCETMAWKPFIFQVTMPDEILFNHEIILDLAWIEPRPHRPVLHIVDRGTRFSASKFVYGECAKSVWNTFVSLWVTAYVGFPNV